MDAAYLKENVGEVLADGLAAVILANPPDKVEYLGMWLLNYVEKKTAEAEAAKTTIAVAAHDARIEQQQLHQQQQRAVAERTRADAEAGKQQSISRALEDAQNFEGVLEAFAQRLKGVCGASSAYVAQRVAADNLKYVAASDDNKFMVDKTLPKSKFITWDLFADSKRRVVRDANGDEVDDPDAEPEPEPADAEPQDGDEELTDAERAERAAKKAAEEKKKLLELRQVFVGNVLMGENANRIKFFRMPNTGSYHAVRVAYPALLNEATLDAVPKTRADLAEKNKKIADEKAAAEKLRIQSLLNPFAPPKKEVDGEGEDEDDGGRDSKRDSKRRHKKNSKSKDADDDDDDDDDAPRSAKGKGKGKKPAGKKGAAAAAAADEKEPEEEEDLDDLEAFTAAALAAAEADAAADAADADDPDLEDAERAARKLKRSAERAQKLAAADAMRKQLAEKKAAEQALTPEQKEARAKKQAEEAAQKAEAELLETIGKRTVEYAVCADTLGQNRRFSDAELAEVMRFTALLQTTLIRIDRKLFLEELARRDALAKYGAENEKNEEDVAAEIEEKRLAWLKEHKDQKDAKQSPEEAAFRYRKDVVYSLRAAIAEFRTYNVFKGPLQVLQCLFYMLDYTQVQVADKDNVADWKRMRLLFSEPLFNAILAYDPTVEQVRGRANAYAKIKNLQKLLKGITYDQLKQQNLPLAELFAYIDDALKLKKRARDERKKAEDARKAAEAKEKARAEKEAAREARLKAKQEAASKAADDDADEPDDDD